MTTSFSSAADLFQHVATKQRQINLVGMLKEGDDPSIVKFAPTSCEEWMEIPSRLISNLEFLYETPCIKPGEEAHKHPVVRLILKEEASAAAPHLRVLENVLRQMYDASTSQGSQSPQLAGQVARGFATASPQNMPPPRAGEGSQRPQDTPPSLNQSIAAIRPLVDCQYGYGSCGQWNPYFQVYCDSNRRPCYEANNYCWCRLFPECG